MNIPFEKIAENVLGFSVVVSTDSAEIVEKASFVSLGEVGYEALLREVFSYHLNLAIANVMITRNLLGKANYARIQDGIFEALCHILTTTGEPLGNNKELFAPNNKDIAQMYFSKDAHGLRVSEEQIIWYADRYDKPMIRDIPPDQVAIVYYLIRIARIVTSGKDIDKFIVHYVSTLVIDRALELQDELRKCLL
jgi:hypothetical protein